MGHIKVDFAAVSALGSSIDTEVGQINTLLEDLRGQIQKLEQIWEGSANEGFQATQRKWNDAARDLNATLARIATAVHTAHDNYNQTETANANRWG